MVLSPDIANGPGKSDLFEGGSVALPPQFLFVPIPEFGIRNREILAESRDTDAKQA